MKIKDYFGNKGFAVSGIIYPILILTLFLIVQILTMMSSRKAILDKNKQQLLDSVNRSNKIYNNEELSILIGEQQSKIQQHEQLINSQKTTIDGLKQENADLKKKVGTYFKASENIPLFNLSTTYTLGQGKSYLIVSTGGAWQEVGGLWYASTGDGSHSTIKVVNIVKPDHCTLTTTNMNLNLSCDTWGGNFRIYEL